MAFDFKKEFKEFYKPKNKPEIVNVPKANYIAVILMILTKIDCITRFICLMQRKVAPEKWKTVIRHPIKKA